MIDNASPSNPESLEHLAPYLSQLPEPVHLHVWADENGTTGEIEFIRLARSMAQRFETLSFELLSPVVDYPYYPLIGVLGVDNEEPVDYGIRLIGLPAGHQFTSLLAAIQSVSFHGMTSEAITRIRISQLREDVRIELVTSAEDEGGVLVAHALFNMAVSSSFIRAYLIMADSFPDVLVRYSINTLPHIVINSRTHISGIVGEAELLKHIAETIKLVPQ